MLFLLKENYNCLVLKPVCYTFLSISRQIFNVIVAEIFCYFYFLVTEYAKLTNVVEQTY